MKPVDFPETNKVFSPPEGMADCASLYVYSDDAESVSLWRPSLKERLSVLVFGRVWLFVRQACNHPPVYIGANRTAFGDGEI